MNFRLSFSISTKNAIGILIGVAPNPQITLVIETTYQYLVFQSMNINVSVCHIFFNFFQQCFSVLVGCVFPEVYPCLLGYPVPWCTFVHGILS